MTDLSRVSRRSILAMPLALAACKFGSDVFRFSGPTMGTSFNVVAANVPTRVDKPDVTTAINSALAEVNSQMSNWDPDSEISLFNARPATEPVAVSKALGDVMSAAASVHDASGARFDTTVGPLIELWGFGASGTTKVPGEADIAAAMARSGHANTLEVGQGTLRKTLPGTQVYLAAIGKGFGADAVGRALESLGIHDYMVEIGGDLYASGHNPERLPWQIGIEAPKANSRDVLDVVGISDLGLASSGDYRNFFEHDGKRFSHIVDPRTGRPVKHSTASATVLAENAMLADAWATAMHTMGKEEGVAVAEDLGLAVQFTERKSNVGPLGFKTTSSTRFKALTS